MAKLSSKDVVLVLYGAWEARHNMHHITDFLLNWELHKTWRDTFPTQHAICYEIKNAFEKSWENETILR